MTFHITLTKFVNWFSNSRDTYHVSLGYDTYFHKMWIVTLICKMVVIFQILSLRLKKKKDSVE
jgi:hypothetical protein